MLTSRERVLYALNHEEPDRVPIFFGAGGVTSMLAPAYERLKEHFEIRTPARTSNRVFQYALLDEEVMERFGSDGRPVVPGPAPSPHRRDIDDHSFVDDWGIEWSRRPGSLYYELVREPLRDATVDDLDTYQWPDLGHPDRFIGLADQARSIQDGGHAAVALAGVDPFEMVLLLRGMDAFLMDMAADPEFAEALINKVSALMLAALNGLLDAAGEHIDVVSIADDLGDQRAPLISTSMYRRFLKPRHAEFTSAIRARSSAKVFFHTDGNVYPLIPDLIEAGVDILNPIQVSAKEMGDTARLKREFGDRLSFSGAIDNHLVLPNGSPDDVRSEVRRRIADLGPGGGYILSAVHAIQPDVPLENVIAMFDEAKAAGRYPLKS